MVWRMTTTPPPPPPQEPPAGPPPGGPPPGGPPPGGPPPGYASNDEKTWVLISHFGGIVVGFVAPLVAMLVKGNESATVRAHAVESLNFQITWNVAAVIAWVLAACTGFLFFLPVLVWLFIVVMCILAGLKANEGQWWTYPAKVVLIK
jgi:uncharacterized Tic20 family protein